MSVDIGALVNRLGDTYDDIYDDGLIPYKSVPDGDFDDDVVTLDMKKEYVFLAFEHPSKILKSITITVIPSNMRNGWKFPNEIPFGLEQVMTDQWLYSHLGMPIRTAKEKIVAGRSFGKMEVFILPDNFMEKKIAMSMRYGYKRVNVEKITFELLNTVEERWKDKFHI
jgi:hypothetical protein